MNLDKVFQDNEKWIETKLALNPNYFQKLSEGQQPEMLYIGCSDSRVPAEDIMRVNPGELFVHRNIANMVVGTDMNVMSVIKYAVDNLKVKHVIVCGHYGCGGVKAAMESKDLGVLNPWLRNIRDVYRTHKKKLNAITDETEKYKKLVELNVQEQCINLLKTSIIQKGIRNKGLEVYGWVFDIHTGKLIDLKIDFNAILKDIREIYHLD